MDTFLSCENNDNNNQNYAPEQRNRCAFELVEDGENKDLLDNVRFYVDGMASKFATSTLRR